MIERHSVGDGMIEVGRFGRREDAETVGAVSLWVRVNEEDFSACRGERCAKVYGGGGLADAALLVDDCCDESHENWFLLAATGRIIYERGCWVKAVPRGKAGNPKQSQEAVWGGWLCIEEWSPVRAYWEQWARQSRLQAARGFVKEGADGRCGAAGAEARGLGEVEGWPVSRLSSACLANERDGKRLVALRVSFRLW